MLTTMQRKLAAAHLMCCRHPNSINEPGNQKEHAASNQAEPMITSNSSVADRNVLPPQQVQLRWLKFYEDEFIADTLDEDIGSPTSIIPEPLGLARATSSPVMTHNGQRRSHTITWPVRVLSRLSRRSNIESRSHSAPDILLQGVRKRERDSSPASSGHLLGRQKVGQKSMVNAVAELAAREKEARLVLAARHVIAMEFAATGKENEQQALGYVAPTSAKQSTIAPRNQAAEELAAAQLRELVRFFS